MFNEKIDTDEQITFILNGKPYVPGQPKPPPEPGSESPLVDSGQDDGPVVDESSFGKPSQT